MDDAKILNGVNVGAVDELVKYVGSDPNLGECKLHIKYPRSTCEQNQSL
ncbi:hypothetical protein [Nitrospira sp. Ecomares 2.1]